MALCFQSEHWAHDVYSRQGECTVAINEHTNASSPRLAGTLGRRSHCRARIAPTAISEAVAHQQQTLYNLVQFQAIHTSIDVHRSAKIHAIGSAQMRSHAPRDVPNAKRSQNEAAVWCGTAGTQNTQGIKRQLSPRAPLTVVCVHPQCRELLSLAPRPGTEPARSPGTVRSASGSILV